MKLTKTSRNLVLSADLFLFSQASQAQLSNGLLNYWDFEGDFEDSAGSVVGSASTVDDNGTNNAGNVAFAAGGPLGGFGDFERDFVEVPNSDDILAVGEDLTISAWFRVDGFDQNWQALIAHGESTDYRIARRAGENVMSYAGGIGGVDIPGPGGGPNINDGGWHHVVAVTANGVSISLWVDGELVETRTGAAALTNNGPAFLAIGGNAGAAGDGNGAYRPWNGGIDDVAMWNRPLTPAEIETIYNAGVAQTSLAGLLDNGDDDNDDLPNVWEDANGLARDDGTGDNGRDGDPDMDDFTNFEEFTAGTDPQKPDTDEDGSNDGPERDNATDPLDPDSDDDGLMDGVETNTDTFNSPTDTGTDPNDNDSDDDNVIDGLEVTLGSDPNNIADIPPATSLPIIDDFEDGILNTIDWMVDLNVTPGGASITEEDGILEFVGRGHLVTVAQFDPTVLGAISITGEYTPKTANEFFAVLTRSDGMPAGDFGETNSGVEFVFNATNDVVNIVTRGDFTVGNVQTSGAINIDIETAYLFSIIDNGAGFLSCKLTQKDDPSNTTYVTADLTLDNTDTNHIVVHNRAGTNCSDLAEIKIELIPDTDNDGMDDRWEMANGLDVGTDDSGLDPDNDGLVDTPFTNLEEYQACTNPQAADTDMDMSNDGVEARLGTDLLVADTDGDGLLDGVETNTGNLISDTDTGSDPLDGDSDDDGTNDGTEVNNMRDPNNPNDAAPGLGKGLLAYWNFDNNLDDVAANFPTDSFIADNGAFIGPEGDRGYAAEGLFGASALELNGGAGWVEVPASVETLRASDNAVTVSAWFKVTAFDKNWQTLISHGEKEQYRISRHQANDAFNYAGGSPDIQGGFGLNNNEWHHVVAISEAGVNTRLYIDGLQVATGAEPVLNNTSEGVIPNLLFGANPQRGFRTWNGLMDDIAIWGRPITDEEIASIYAEGTGASIESLLLSGPTELAISDVQYDVTTDQVTISWPATEGTTYSLFYSPDLQDWDSDISDSIDATVVNTDPFVTFDGTTLTYGPFDRPENLEKAFFRVEQ